MTRMLVSLLIVLASTGCGLKLRDLVTVLEPPPSAPAPAPVVEPTPAPAPEPEPPPAPEVPFVNLNVRVLSTDGQPVPGALVENLTIAETRITDGNGFANFGVRANALSNLRVSAADYIGQTRDFVPGGTGEEKFLLLSTKPKPTLLHGVLPGPGGRAEDKQPLPDYGRDVVRQVALANLDDLNRSCKEHAGGNFNFMNKVVDVLRTYDTRWGFNGKRGNPEDPSQDAVAYHWGSGPDEGSIDVYIVDVIGGHCGPVPGPSWNDVTEATIRGGTIGRWISMGRF